MTLGLFCGTAFLALVLAQLRHLGVPQTLVAVLVSGGAPAALYLGWASYRDDRSAQAVAESGRLSLAEVADQLAAAVRVQWHAEAAVHRLNDPYPLPVRWVPADASLFDEWGWLASSATSRAGWPTRAGTWAVSPGELSGEGNKLAALLPRVPTGRLVVLGEPGAGKTMLMVRLAMDLLESRARGGAVPVLVPVASWNPAEQDLYGWLAAQLSIAWPALNEPAPLGTEGTNRIGALLASGLIFPILDGLDEIPDAVRGSAIAGINNARPGERLVVTCRTAPYRNAVRPADGIEVTLHAAGIELRPLDTETVANYLREDAGGPAGAARWDLIFGAPQSHAPVMNVLSNPLMIGLARIIYNPRPGENAGALPDLTVLCDLPDEAAIRDHLFDAFIPAAYRYPPRPSTEPRWSAEDAGVWLAFLARHLEYNIRSPDLGWWQLFKIASRGMTGLAVGLATGLITGLAVGAAFAVVGLVVGWLNSGYPTRGLAFGLKFEFLAALAAGLVAGLTGAVTTVVTSEVEQRPSRRTRWNLRSDLLAEVTAGGVAGVLVGAVITVVTGIAAGVGAGLAFGIAAIGISRRARRRGIILNFRKGSRAGVVLGVVIALTFGIAVWNLIGPASALSMGLTAGVVGGLTAGLVALTADKGDHRPASGTHWNGRKASLIGATAGLVVGLLSGLGHGLGSALTSGLTSGLAFGVAIGIVVGMERIPGQLSTAVSPETVLARDRRTTLVRAVVTVVAAGIVAGVAAGIKYGLLSGNGLRVGLALALALGLTVGLEAGLIFVLTISGFGSAWPYWVMARIWLALRRRLPCRLMTFLAEAHELGVLRQFGAVYQFRHIELQRRLASYPCTKFVSSASSAQD